MKTTPLISFISVNYNGWSDTCELIESIQRNIRSFSYEIIIVDNASFPDEVSLFKEKYPLHTIIRSEKNLGFAGGNNLGIQQAKGTFLFFINNDTYINSESGLKKIIKRMSCYPEIGGISPKIKYAYPPYHIQFAGFTSLSSITLRNNIIGFEQSDESKYNLPSPTPYLHGAAMIIKREVITKVGMMPEIYFLYYEELDWSTQIIQAGYALWYEPSFTVYHKESKSTGKESRTKIYYQTRNRLIYAWRNLDKKNKWLSITYQIVIVNLRNTIRYILRGQISAVATHYCAIRDFFGMKNKTM